jgi:hypothetical protein
MPLDLDEMARVGKAALGAPYLAEEDAGPWYYEDDIDEAFPVPLGTGNLAVLAAACPD